MLPPILENIKYNWREYIGRVECRTCIHAKCLCLLAIRNDGCFASKVACVN